MPSTHVTPPQRRADDDTPGLAELARMIAALTKSFEDMRADLRTAVADLTPREVHDLALGGVKVDIRRLDEERVEIEKRVDRFEEKVVDRFAQVEAETNRRFRTMVYAIFASVGGPLTVYLVIRSLTAGAV